MIRNDTAQGGFTLFEVLLALAASALLLSAVMPMLSMSVAAATSPATNEQAELERQAAFVIERIARAVRAKAPAVLAAPPGATGFMAIFNPVAQDPGTSGTWLAPATFQLAGAKAPFTLVEKRDGDAVTHVLADSVTSIQFTALPVSDGRQLIRVDLVLQTANAAATVSSVMRMGWLQ
jgi:prepilin-type N-terminal cleavage/methylation domain-containing protein